MRWPSTEINGRLAALKSIEAVFDGDSLVSGRVELKPIRVRLIPFRDLFPKTHRRAFLSIRFAFGIGWGRRIGRRDWTIISTRFLKKNRVSEETRALYAAARGRAARRNMAGWWVLGVWWAASRRHVSRRWPGSRFAGRCRPRGGRRFRMRLWDAAAGMAGGPTWLQVVARRLFFWDCSSWHGRLRIEKRFKAAKGLLTLPTRAVNPPPHPDRNLVVSRQNCGDISK